MIWPLVNKAITILAIAGHQRQHDGEAGGAREPHHREAETESGISVSE